MRGRLADLSFGLGGRQRVTFEIDGDFREEADRLQGCELDIAVKKHRKRRSLDANAYFWALCGKLAAATGQPREAVYRACIRDIGGNYETVCVQEYAAEKLREDWGHNGLGVGDRHIAQQAAGVREFAAVLWQQHLRRRPDGPVD